jgi:hypothetical protein
MLTSPLTLKRGAHVAGRITVKRGSAFEALLGEGEHCVLGLFLEGEGGRAGEALCGLAHAGTALTVFLEFLLGMQKIVEQNRGAQGEAKKTCDAWALAEEVKVTARSVR